MTEHFIYKQHAKSAHTYFVIFILFTSTPAISDMACFVKYPSPATHYAGICDNGIANGFGTVYTPTGDAFSGNFKNGILHGVATKSIETKPGWFDKSICYFVNGKLTSESEYSKYIETLSENDRIIETKNKFNQELEFDEGQKRQAEQNKQAEQERIARVQHEENKPKCKTIKFTGYAAIYPQQLLQLHHAQNPQEIVSTNPISCTDSTWGGRYIAGGAIVNQNKMTECRGVAYFKNQTAEIIDWKDDAYRVNSLVQFDSGKKKIPLFIWKKDARCLKRNQT